MTQDDVGVIKHPLHLQGPIRAAAHVVAFKNKKPTPKMSLIFRLHEMYSLFDVLDLHTW